VAPALAPTPDPNLEPDGPFLGWVDRLFSR
jgi:hypothetical protein